MSIRDISGRFPTVFGTRGSYLLAATMTAAWCAVGTEAYAQTPSGEEAAHPPRAEDAPAPTAPMFGPDGLPLSAAARAAQESAHVDKGLLPSSPSGADGARAVLVAYVNGGVMGDVFVVVRGDDVLLRKRDFDTLGIGGTLGRPIIFDNVRYVSLRAHSPSLDFQIDAASTSLRIKVDPRLLAAHVIELRHPPTTGVVYSRTTSAFANYAFSLADLRRPSATLEAGINSHGALFYSNTYFNAEHGAVRGMTNVTIDDRSRLRRWVVGDMFHSTGQLGGSQFLAGLSVSRNYDLDPYLSRIPALGYNGVATTPSVVDVYVNGNRIRREVLAPGPFELRNLPVATGGSTVQYVVRDAFGQERVASYDYFLSTRLLAKGLDEYGVAVGAERLSLATESFRYGDTTALGSYRRGVSNGVTVGGRAEVTTERASAGPSLAVLLPIGQFDLATSVSGDAEGGPGGAAFASYSYGRKGFNANIGVRAQSDTYATTVLTARDDRALVDGSASIAVGIGPLIWLTSRYTLASFRDAGTASRVGFQGSARLNASLQLGVVAGIGRGPDAKPTYDAYVGLTYSFGGRIAATAGLRSAPRLTEGVVDVVKTLPIGTGYGVRASAGTGHGGHALVGTQYQWEYGRYQATLDAGPDGAHLTLDAAGGLVFVNGSGVFLTRPVQSGFAVIQVPGVRNVRGYVYNQEVGRTNGSGNLFVPFLTPNYGNRLSIKGTDLPPDRTIGTTELLIAPPFRGGALARFEAPKIQYYRGRVHLTRKGVDARAMGADLSIETAAGIVTSPVARDGGFELSGVKAGSYPAQVQWDQGACQFTLAIPDDPSTVVELGAHTCDEH